MAWHGMAWYGMVWYGKVWYVMIWYGLVWYGMVSYGMVWHGMVLSRCFSVVVIKRSRRDIEVCGVAVLFSFWCGIPVNKFPRYGVAVISNPATVFDFCAFKHVDHALWTVYTAL